MQIIPLSFDPPRTAVLNGFSLDMLRPFYADLDYAAVTASANTIRHLFGPNNSWPAKDISYVQNKADLERHEREFDEKTAFAYAILDNTEQKYLGCVYLMPIGADDERSEQFNAQAFIWLSTLHAQLDLKQTTQSINDWFNSAWHLPAVAWPGRVQNWQDWHAFHQPT